jgi:hypothetical protein
MEELSIDDFIILYINLIRSIVALLYTKENLSKKTKIKTGITFKEVKLWLRRKMQWLQSITHT